MVEIKTLTDWFDTLEFDRKMSIYNYIQNEKDIKNKIKMNRVYSYAAGLFEGEGCITLYFDKNNEGNRNKYPSVKIALVNTDYKLLEFMYNTFGGYIYKRKKEKQTHSDAWVWYISNIDKVISVLEKMFPYMKHHDKWEKSRLIIEDYKFRVKKGVNVTKEDIKNNREFYNEFYANRKGYN